ncbi:MAG: discoidin domain-containing protein [Fibrobacterales bacterium]
MIQVQGNIKTILFLGILCATTVVQAKVKNLALNKVIATNDQSPELSPHLAIDGKTGKDSRWASQIGNGPYHLIVDLGANYSIDKVMLNWEDASAKEYTIETSTDLTNWERVAEVTNGKRGETKEISFTETTAKFVKLNCIQRTTSYGYSLYEMEVWGESDTKDTSNNVLLEPIGGTPFKFIRVGDMDGTGWGDGISGNLRSAAGQPLNKDSEGMLYGGDFLPDLDRAGTVKSGGGDEFDNRDGAEKANMKYSSRGAEVGSGTSGSQWTDVEVSWDTRVVFAFDFSVKKGLVNPDTALYFNLIFGDYDVSGATLHLITQKGKEMQLPIKMQNKTGKGEENDGLIQTAYAELSFDDVFYTIENGYHKAYLEAVFQTNGDPYLTFDFAEVSIVPIQPDIVIAPGPAYLEVDDKELAAGDTIDLMAEVYDVFDERYITDSDNFTWSMVGNDSEDGDALFKGDKGVWKFTATNAFRTLQLMIEYVDPAYPKRELSEMVTVSIGPGEPYGIDLQKKQESDNRKKYAEQITVTLGENHSSETVYAVVRDRFGNLVEFTETLDWSVDNRDVAEVDSDGPTSAEIVMEAGGEAVVIARYSGLEPDTARLTVVEEIVEVVEVAQIELAYIEDSDSDGRADQITVVFDMELDQIPEEITSIDWPHEGAQELSVSKKDMAFVTNEWGSEDRSRLVITLPEGSLEQGVTAADEDNIPTLELNTIEIPIVDSIGPVILEARKYPSHYKRYAVETDDSVVVQVAPDTLIVTLSEEIKTPIDAKINRMFRLIQKHKEGTLTVVEEPIALNDTRVWMILVHNSSAENPPRVGDRLMLNSDIEVGDIYNNISENASVEITGIEGKAENLRMTFRESVVGISSDKGGSIPSETIPLYDADGDLIEEQYSVDIPLGETWVAPVDGVVTFDSDGNAECSDDDDESEEEFRYGCSASMVTVTGILDGAYRADIAIYDNIGQFITQWTQHFGYCGEFDNAERQNQSNQPGLFINDLKWDLKDTQGRNVGSGIYMWKVTYYFASGEKHSVTRTMGVVRSDVSEECEEL